MQTSPPHPKIPPTLHTHLQSLSSCLPTSPTQKQKLLSRYSSIKGYQFLNPKSKLYKYFQYLCQVGDKDRRKEFQGMGDRERGVGIQERVFVRGGIQEGGVGVMCEIVKDGFDKGVESYQPIQENNTLHQINFTKDEQLYNKTITLLHTLIQTHPHTQTQLQAQVPQNPPLASSTPIPQYRKQQATRQDGSLGAWGGKKYEGLGSQNEFTNFRREQSMNYYHTQAQAQTQGLGQHQGQGRKL